MRTIIAILLFGSAVVSAQTNRPLAAVNTVADLVARKSVNNERVIVSGWRTPGDWGPERIIRHDPASVAATNMGCVFASSTAGRYIADDCESGQVNVRWWGGTNDLTALAAALTHVLSRPDDVEIVDRAVWLADGTAPTAATGTMALYSTNLAGAQELAIVHGGGSNNIVATKAWVGSTITGTAVTSVGATSGVAGLSFSGSPVTTTGTLGLTGVVGEASIDIAIARLASPALSGNPTAPTETPGDNDTSISTTAFVSAAIEALKALQLWQDTNAVLTTLAALTGGNSSNFFKGTGAFAQVTTNDIPNLVTMLGGLQPLDADLTSIAGLTWTDTNTFLRGDKTLGRDGQNWTNLNASQLLIGTVPMGRLALGSTNSSAGLSSYWTDGTNRWTSRDGQGLTNLNGSEIRSGTISTGVLPGALGTLSTLTPSTINLDKQVSKNFDALAPIGRLSQTVVLEKLSTNYNDFAVYVPASSSDAKVWTRYRFGNSVNKTAGLGYPRLMDALNVGLYLSSNNASYAANLTTGEQSITPVVAQVHTDATSTNGVWIGPATASGATNIFYATNAGSYVEFTVAATNGQRLVWWTYGNASIGHTNMQLSILDSGGTPIPATNWSLPSTNISIRSTASGRYIYELARNLLDTNYVVRITAGTGASTTYRAYSGGVDVCNAFNAEPVGNIGSWYQADSGGRRYAQGFQTASRIYQVYGTKIKWRYSKHPSGGHVALTVFDDGGTEISAGYAITNTAADGRKYIDGYATGMAYRESVIASNLTAGTYRVVIQGLPTKNASSGNYYTFDYGVVGFNESVAGTPGTDFFDKKWESANNYIADGYTMDSEGVGAGNAESGLQVRLLASTSFPTTETGILTGVHGGETAISNFWIFTNGTSVGNWSTSIVDSSWTSRSVQFGCTSYSWVQDGPTNDWWGSITLTNTVDSSGYKYDYTIRAISDVTFGIMGLLMVKPISSDSITNSGWVYNKALGGGFDRLLYGDFRELNQAPTLNYNSYAVRATPDLAFRSNDGLWAVIGEVYDYHDNYPVDITVASWLQHTIGISRFYYSPTGPNGYFTRNLLSGGSIRAMGRIRCISSN